MNINTTLEKLERRAAEQHTAKADYCTCPEMPIIELVPVEANGTAHRPTREQITKAKVESMAQPGDRCPICKKLFRPGQRKQAAIVRGGIDER